VAAPASAVDSTVLPDGFEEVDLGDNNFLGKPTNVEFAPDGRVFVLDEDYAPTAPSVKVKLPGQSQYKRLFNIPHVNIHQDRGIVGMALDKDFEDNGFMYLLYTYEHTGTGPSNSTNARTQRLTRVTVPDVLPPSPVVPAETVLLGSVGTPVSSTQACPYPTTSGSFNPSGSWAPYASTDCIASDSSEHTVDAIVVDPVDGTLWVSVGDGAAGGDFPDPIAFRSQSPDSLNGKLLHIDTQGNGLPTNGTCPGVTDFDRNCTKVFARGFRNPYQFSFRPDGRIVVGDVGWKTREEVDLLSASGKNYGWPCYEGTQQTPLWKDRPECIAFYNASTPHEGPVYEYPYPAGLFSAALIMGPTYVGSGTASDYPDDYDNAVFFSDFITDEVSYMKLNANGTPAAGYPKDFGMVPAAVSWDLALNGDLVYVDIGFPEPGPASDATPAVRQISAVDNRRPTAVIDIDGQPYGDLPLDVDFDAGGSFDPDPGETEQLTYRWDLDGDGALDDSTSETPSEQYTDAENVTVTLEVTDPNGKSDTETLTLYPGDNPPATPVLAPGNPTTYRGGQQVTLEGAASDPDAGDTATLHWAALINHAGTHTHDLDTDSGEQFAFLPDTVHDQPSTYEVTVYAEDERGLRSAPLQRVLQPEKRTLRLESSPSGAKVNHGGVDHTAPYVGQSTIGVKVGISAAQTVFAGGLTRSFQSWSNGGPRSQTLTMPATDLTLTANYGSVLGPPLPPEDDEAPPVLTFSAKKDLNAKKGRFTGTVSDPSGVKRVQVALRAAKKKGGKCRWWSKKAKKLSAKAKACSKPVYMTAKLTRKAGRVTWTLALRKRLPRGRYVVVFRTTDSEGNTGKGRSPVAFRVKR
jgi:PKD repeat protein